MTDFVEATRERLRTTLGLLGDLWWLIRHKCSLAMGAIDRGWWRASRRLFGPGQESQLTLATMLDVRPGQKLVVDAETPGREVLRVVRAEGNTMTVERARRFGRA